MLAGWNGLTDFARAALKSEIQRRGRTIELEDSLQATDKAALPDLVTIRLFRDLPEALDAKGLLESSGIECFLANENIGRLDWFISNAIGNMRLQVAKEDAEMAIEILDNPGSEDAESD
jgi:hypothetical protein